MLYHLKIWWLTRRLVHLKRLEQIHTGSAVQHVIIAEQAMIRISELRDRIHALIEKSVKGRPSVTPVTDVQLNKRYYDDDLYD